MSATVVGRPQGEAPLTLSEPPATELGLRDTVGLWASLGISLLLPVAVAFVVLAGRPLSLTVLAIAVGAVIGAVLLGNVRDPRTFFTGPGDGWTGWWAARQADLGIPAAHGLSASIVSLTVACRLTVAVALPGALRAGQAAAPAR